MGIIEAVGLGALQGLTEFLPISSSGHLSLIQYFLGLEDTPRFFDVMLHVGTLLAVVIYYRSSLWIRPKDLLRLGTSGRENIDPPKTVPGRPGALFYPSPWRILIFLMLATVPAVIAAGIFRPTKLEPGESLATARSSWRNKVGDLREYSSQKPWVVLGFLTCTGFVLLAGARATGGHVDSQTMRWWHAFGVGIAQGVSAICPGLSRSGMTVSTGMLLGLRGEWAVHFSLLMSIPAILGAVVLKSRDLDTTWLTSENLWATFAGTVTSAIVGWFCISLLLRSVRRGRWWWFTIYVWSLVVVVSLVLSFTKFHAS
ncbi:MAG: undecaprenyl-diphosphate phosphatase [Planctomycetota bacterium]